MFLAWLKGFALTKNQPEEKVIVLHCGFHKTATTSFQMTCRRNKGTLALRGWHYPIFSFKAQRFTNHSVPIYSAFSKAPAKYAMNISAGYSETEIRQFNEQTRNHLKRILNGKSRVLLSGESISVLDKDELAELKAFLTQFGHQLKVVCGVRSPYSSVCSSFQEQVKGGRRNGFSDGRVPRKSVLMTRLADVFGDSLTFFSFDSDCQRREGPVTSLFSRNGISAKGFKIVRSNDGLSNLSTRVLAVINSSLKDNDSNKQREFRNKLSRTNISGPKFKLTADEYKRAEEALAVETSFIASHYADLSFNNSVDLTDPVKLNLAAATEVIGVYSTPIFFSEVVLKFCLDHSDGSWSQGHLYESLVSQSSKHRQVAEKLHSQGLLG